MATKKPSKNKSRARYVLRNNKRNKWAYLNTKMVAALGRALQDVGNKFPLRYVTENDFYPLALIWLHGQLPSVQYEYSVEGGRSDIRCGGTNPALLEIAVTRRELVDKFADRAVSPAKTELYGSQNLSELEKLSKIGVSKAKGRFLLLLDLRSESLRDPATTFNGIKDSFKAVAHLLTGTNPITVVYCPREGKCAVFTVKKAAGAPLHAETAQPSSAPPATEIQVHAPPASSS